MARGGTVTKFPRSIFQLPTQANKSDFGPSDSLNQYDLENNTIRLFDEITPETVRDVSRFLQEYSLKPIAVVSPKGTGSATGLIVEIMSPGGCSKSGLAIYEMLLDIRNTLETTSSSITVVTIGQGYVASAATMIFSAGRLRYAYPTTDFIIHEPFTHGVNGTARVLGEQTQYMRVVEDQMYKVYADTTKKKVDRIKKEVAGKELFLTAEEAKAWGLVTHIIGVDE